MLGCKAPRAGVPSARRHICKQRSALRVRGNRLRCVAEKQENTDSAGPRLPRRLVNLLGGTAAGLLLTHVPGALAEEEVSMQGYCKSA